MEDENKTGDEKKGRRPNKGIPSEDQMYLPRKDYLNGILRKEGAIKISTAWALEDVLQFIFPPKYRKSYFSCATLFLQLLREKGELHGSDIGAFVEKNKISKATFYNKVLPRLNRIGMIDRKREIGSNKMIIRWSNEFSIYLEKIAFEWKRLEPQVNEK